MFDFRARAQSGFTLIEVLVVLLIIGLLAAIAIPAFFNQTSKARDSGAKGLARTAQTAAETSATDHDGSYTAVSISSLQSIEPALGDTSSAQLTTATGNSNTFTLVATSRPPNTNSFTVIRNPSGWISRTCTAPGVGACPTGGTW